MGDARVVAAGSATRQAHEPAAPLPDLRAEGPGAVRARLGPPAARTRLIGPDADPADNAAHCLSGGPFAERFDDTGHVRDDTPVRFLAPDHPVPAPGRAVRFRHD
ncbi:hypothetical protein ACIRPT_15295 [Streptomyces sp. NPDC101227]|uniref:hypothetical protein n=1 Tax=Streptomyces sp. NPDC101227 TaxID=3366136 RepID=UPI003824A31C